MKCYQFDLSGQFLGEVEDFGILPNNATYEKRPRNRALL